MNNNVINSMMLNKCEQTENMTTRYLNPNDINLPPGYSIEVFLDGLDAPSCIAFGEDGDLFIGQSGYTSKQPSILRYRNGQIEMLTDGFEAPLTGICYHNQDLYVSHFCKITIVNRDGNKTDIIAGLPSYGDHWNSNVTFGADNKLYFGQGTATNSGVVGIDNLWIKDYPFFCDKPGSYILLRGQNYETVDIFSSVGESVVTGAFSPYGIPNLPYETRKGILKASGSILRANPDGSELELVAWGFRFPVYVKFDRFNRLFVANQSYEIRGSRPIANAPDEFHLVIPGLWYGFTDFSGGEPVTLTRFRPEGGLQPEFLLLNHPNTPPNPYAIFPSNSYIVGFDYNTHASFSTLGDVYISEFGMGGRIPDSGSTPYGGTGHRISKIDMQTGGVTTFAINKSGFSSSITQEGGLSRPVDVAFGPDGALYIVDMGINSIENFSYYYPNTGVIWRISRE